MALINLKLKIKNRKAILFIVFTLSIHILLMCPISDATSDFGTSLSSSFSGADLIYDSEVENLKLEATKLESILEENTNILNSKTVLLEENNQLIEELKHKTQDLQSSLIELKESKSDSSGSDTMVMALEEEVRLLWAESKKNKFDYHMLESKINQEDNQIDTLHSEVEKMEAVVNEQWIQIRQLEQSLQMMKSMTSKVIQNASKRKGFNLLKFVKGIGHHHLPNGAGLPDSLFLGDYTSKSCITRAVKQLRRRWSAIKTWHYELQDSVKWFLESNEFTAPLAHQEVVFFMASASVVVPIMIAWSLLL